MEEKEAVVYVEGGIEGEWASFCCCILAEESSILRFAAAIFFSGKNANWAGCAFSWRVSRKAWMTKRKRIGDMLSP